MISLFRTVRSGTGIIVVFLSLKTRRIHLALCMMLMLVKEVCSLILIVHLVVKACITRLSLMVKVPTPFHQFTLSLLMVIHRVPRIGMAVSARCRNFLHHHSLRQQTKPSPQAKACCFNQKACHTTLISTLYPMRLLSHWT